MRYVRQTGIKTQIWHHKRCPSTKTTSLNQLFGKCFRHTSKQGHILYICIDSAFCRKLFQSVSSVNLVVFPLSRHVVLFFGWVIWHVFIQHPNLLDQEMFVAALLQAKDSALNEWRLVIRMKIKHWQKIKWTCHFKLLSQQGNAVPIDWSQGYEVAQHDTARQKEAVVWRRNTDRGWIWNLDGESISVALR